MTDKKIIKSFGLGAARLFVALLAIGLFIGSNPAFALANELDSRQVAVADEAIVHPRGLAPQAQSPQDPVIPPQPDDDGTRDIELSTQASEVPFFDNLDATVKYVRARAKEREGIIDITVSEEVYHSLDLTGCSDVLAHTGDPAGGDYLSCSMVYYQATEEQRDDETWLIEYYFSYFDDAEQEAEATQATHELVDVLGLKDESVEDYDKIKAIHDYIVENVSFDYDTVGYGSAVHPAKFCGYGAIVEGNAVCQGYSCMFYRLALEAGIDCRIIRSDELQHAWNIVLLDGKYYLMDCTWDDTEQTTNYFLRGSRDFGHLNTDDEFSNDAFAQRYPLHEFARDSGMSPVEGDVVAPDYPLLTWDGRVTSTAAQNGRAKVLIFMCEGYDWGEGLIQSLVGKGTYPGVDVLVCYMAFEVENHLSWLNKIGASAEYPTNIPATYCYGGGAYTAMHEMEKLVGIYDEDYDHPPTVFFITPQNNILLAEQGFEGDLDALIYRYLADEDAPAPADEPVDDTCRAFGACGDHAIWRFHSDGTLRIEGAGALYDNLGFMIGWLTEQDWESLRALKNVYWDGTITQPYVDLVDEKGTYTLNPLDVKYVEVGEGITQLGAYSLSYFPNATIRFLGHAPILSEEAVTYFDHAAITTDGYQIVVKYPRGDATWTQRARNTLTWEDDGVIWVSVDDNGMHHHVWGAWEVQKNPTTKRTGKSKCACLECRATKYRTLAKLKSISTAKVKLGANSYVYDGKAKSPGVKSVVLGGVRLANGSDYRVRKVPSGRTKVGTYTYVVEGIGAYGDTAEASFKITKATNPLTAKAVSRSASLAVLKSKDVTVARPLTVSKAQGKLAYAKVAKESSAALSVNKSTGKVTVKKGTKKGDYTIKIKVTAAGNANYNSGSKTVACTVTVK